MQSKTQKLVVCSLGLFIFAATASGWLYFAGAKIANKQVDGTIPNSRAESVPQTILYPPPLLSTTPLVNPLSGYYTWRGQTANVPFTSPQPTDAYDRYWWSDLEPTKGDYKFDKIISSINAAKAKGQKYAFRIRALSGKQATDYSGEYKKVPQYLIDENCAIYDVGGYRDYVPKWDDQCFKDRAEALYAEAEAKLAPYKNDIAWVDIGLYGQWGEWTMYDSPNANVKASNSTLRWIIDLHAKHFGSNQLLMQIGADKIDADQTGDPLVYAMSLQASTTLKKPIGLRSDCADCGSTVPNSNIDGKTKNSSTWRYPPWKDRWLAAPFIVETGTGGSFATLQTTVPKFHISSVGNGNIYQIATDTATKLTGYQTAFNLAGYRYAPAKVSIPTDIYSGAQVPLTISFTNTGSAPTYDTWKVSLLIRRQNVDITESNVPITLSSLKARDVSSTSDISTQFTAPQSEGAYDIALKVVDPSGVRKPMSLALSTVASADGSYKLGSITVKKPTRATPIDSVPAPTGTSSVPNTLAGTAPKIIATTLSGQQIITVKNGQQVSQGSLLSIDPATVTDDSIVQQIIKVEFFDGEKVVETKLEPPFVLDTAKLPAGKHTILQKTYFKNGDFSKKSEFIEVKGAEVKSAVAKKSTSTLLIGTIIIVLLGLSFALAIVCIIKKQKPQEYVQKLFTKTVGLPRTTPIDSTLPENQSLIIQPKEPKK